MLALDWLGERLLLSHERALHWPRTATLIVADVHLGKAAAFRAAGRPVPEACTQADLDRLDALIASTGARRLIVLGDLIHARTGRAPETVAAVAAWRDRRRDLAVVLIRGNHDRHAGDPPGDWRVEVVDDELVECPFVLRHDPASSARGYVLAGHIHPAVRLWQTAGGGLRAPCFAFARGQALLPAFGSFTGCHVIEPAHEDRIFVIGPDAVVEAPRRQPLSQRGGRR
ncbi:MAG TPA: ligase-associated DNA damage response endonuclease PdeM [Planctomycetota bacterium]|nr:ligase-associated DNA damage response endonuclease PdeM [Planctomycetota bacterium]